MDADALAASSAAHTTSLNAPTAYCCSAYRQNRAFAPKADYRRSARPVETRRGLWDWTKWPTDGVFFVVAACCWLFACLVCCCLLFVACLLGVVCSFIMFCHYLFLFVMFVCSGFFIVYWTSYPAQRSKQTWWAHGLLTELAGRTDAGVGWLAIGPSVWPD